MARMSGLPPCLHRTCPVTTTVRVIRSSDFLRARADGHVDLEAGKALLQKVANAAAVLDRYEVLIDIRDAVGRLPADDVHELADSLVHYRGPFLHKTAVLCPRERFDNARLFATLA